MNEGEFWNNLDSFVDQKNPASKEAGKKEIERVGTWLQDIQEHEEKSAKETTSKSPSRYKYCCLQSKKSSLTSTK